MNNLDHVSESLEAIFWVKILKFFDADPGWKKIRIRDGQKVGSGIRDKHPGSVTLPKNMRILRIRIPNTVTYLASSSS